MIKHIVMWEFKDEIESDKKIEVLEKIEKELVSLIEKVGVVVDIKIIRNILPSSMLILCLIRLLKV